MGLEDAFEVATEFRFDVGQAILNTNALKGAVDDLSTSASTALGGLSYLASGLVAHLGFGSGGLLTVLSRSVSLAEEFTHGSLGFVNSIGTNFRMLDGTIYSFNDQLGTSKMLMGNITKAADDLGLSAPMLAQMTTTFAAPLAARGKLGTNYENAIGLAKNASIASEATGLNPFMVQETILRALNPGQGFGGKLFERLLNTKAFQEAHISRPGQGANLNVDRKIDVITRALGELGNNADYLAARTMSLTTSFQMLKGQINEVLRPIGEAIGVPIRKLMQSITFYLKQHGQEFGKNIADMLGGIIQDPKKLFVNLLELRDLKDNFHKALDWASVITTLSLVRTGLQWFGITLNGGLLRRASEGLISLAATILPKVGYFLGVAARFIKVAVGEFVLAFAPLMFFFTIISRAIAIAKWESLTKAADMLTKISGLGLRMKEAFVNVMLPLNMAIDFWANLISPLFETTFWLAVATPLLTVFANVLEFVGNSVLILTNIFSAFNYMVIGFVMDLVHLKNPFTNALGNLKTGFDDFYQAHNPENRQAAKYQVTNNNHIEARFDMREQMEPDRIAFAVTTHLKKLALSPTQGKNDSLGSGFARPNFAGGR